MSGEETQQSVQPENKAERKDELDVIGGLLIRFFQKMINSFKNVGNSSNK